MIRTFGMDLCKWYNFKEHIESEKDIDIYIDTSQYHSNSNVKIYFQSEPNEIYNCYNHLRHNHNLYDHILCYDNTIAPYNTKAIVRLCGGTWIKKEDYETIDIDAKLYKISNICGTKKITNSQKSRIDVYMNQIQLRDYPIIFFRSGVGGLLPNINNNPILASNLDSKISLFKDFQYSIVIENTREINCFSEKLIDCLITKTIPIYFGCINISDYFDTSGWIILETLDMTNELKEKLKILTSTSYTENMKTIMSNYEKAKYHGNYINGCVDALTKIPGIRIKSKI